MTHPLLRVYYKPCVCWFTYGIKPSTRYENVIAMIHSLGWHNLISYKRTVKIKNIKSPKQKKKKKKLSLILNSIKENPAVYMRHFSFSLLPQKWHMRKVFKKFHPFLFIFFFFRQSKKVSHRTINQIRRWIIGIKVELNYKLCGHKSVSMAWHVYVLCRLLHWTWSICRFVTVQFSWKICFNMPVTIIGHLLLSPAVNDIKFWHSI